MHIVSVFINYLLPSFLKKFAAVNLAIMLSISSFAQSGFVSVKGKDIIDGAGNKLILRGINLGNWLVPEGYMFKFKYASSPQRIYEVLNQLIGPAESKKFWMQFRQNYITMDDIKFIKQAGFNSVRIPFNYRLFVIDDNPDMLEGPGYELLSKAIDWCREVNLYVILDMHCAPGGQTGDNIDDSYGYPFLFENPESRKLTAAVWKKIAEKFKDETIVIGYDLLNEPIAHYFNSEQLNPLLEPLYKEIAAEIRKTDKNHLIFLGGAQWDGNFKVFGPPFDSKLVYTFHKYWTEADDSVIKEYLDFRDKYNVPVWMGESGENTNEWIAEFRNTLEKSEIGWCFWPYKKPDSESCPVSFSLPEEYSSIIKFADGGRVAYEDLRNNRPDIKEVRKALYEYLENCKFRNCYINNDYLTALGL